MRARARLADAVDRFDVPGLIAFVALVAAVCVIVAFVVHSWHSASGVGSVSQAERDAIEQLDCAQLRDVIRADTPDADSGRGPALALEQSRFRELNCSGRPLRISRSSA
jgi:hypothetical protein